MNVWNRARAGRFVVVWAIPLAALFVAVAIYIYVEDRIYFYDPRGFQLVAMSLSSSIRSGPSAFLEIIQSMARSEYPPYWALPLIVIPPELLNHRSIYILSMALLGLIPTVILLARIAARLMGTPVRMSTVIIAAFNPVTFLICVQGVPDLIGFAFILGSLWILVSRPMSRKALFWALILGALAALVKKNFLFDLVLVCVLYLASYVVVAIKDRLLSVRLKHLGHELLSVRFIAGAVLAVGLVQVFTPGTTSAIFGRDNSLFYASYQEPIGTVLSENMSYAGGLLGMIVVLVAVAVLLKVIVTGASGGRGPALLVLGFIVASEVIWAIIQKQSGLIHQIHVWPLALTVGFVGVVTLLPARRSRVIEVIVCVVVLTQFVYMFAPATAVTSALRAPINSWPLFLQLRVSAPKVQSNVAELVGIAERVQEVSSTSGPILVPIGSNALNSNILSEVYSQRMSTVAPDIYAMPQVDLQDALPWSTLVGDEGRVVLVSTSWNPSPQDGRKNLLAVDEFLGSDAAQRWVTGSQPLDAGAVGELADLRLVEIRIPQSDALAFGKAIREYLPTSEDLGIESRLALLSDYGRRTSGPSSQTPDGWTTIVGAETAPTRVLVNGGDELELTPQGGDCTGLSYTWQDLSDPAVSTVGEGRIPSAGGPVDIPEGQSQPWSLVLTLGLQGEITQDCAVTIAAR